MLTLVEVGECFIMQFNSWRSSCTQNILKGKDLVLVVWRQVGLLLFEDGEGEHIAGEQRPRTKLLVSCQSPIHPPIIKYTEDSFCFWIVRTENNPYHIIKKIIILSQMKS